jgi:hypothetical protein
MQSQSLTKMIIVLGICALFMRIAIAEPITGSICVAPLPYHAKEGDDDYRIAGGVKNYSYLFKVCIDGGVKTVVPLSGEPVLIENLDLNKKHKMVIYDKEKVIESFFFSFKARKSNCLCLSYTPGYQTWSLEVPQSGAKWCKCPE